MNEQGVSQSELSRISGVSQPSISQMLSGEINPSDDQIDRLLSCLGHRLRVRRDSVEPPLRASERRSWELHRRVSEKIDRNTLEKLGPLIADNLEGLRERVRGEPHLGNIERWEALLSERSIPRIKRVLTGLDRVSIEMREVSPFRGFLSDEERRDALNASD